MRTVFGYQNILPTVHLNNCLENRIFETNMMQNFYLQLLLFFTFCSTILLTRATLGLARFPKGDNGRFYRLDVLAVAKTFVLQIPV